MKRVTALMFAFACIHVSVALAGTKCHVTEFPDRYEAVCEGNEKNKSIGFSQAVKNAAISSPVSTGAPAPIVATDGGSIKSPQADTVLKTARKKGAALSPAVKQLISYRSNKLHGTVLDAKRAVRINNTREMRQAQLEEQKLITPEDD